MIRKFSNFQISTVSNSPDLSFIIVNYNSTAYTHACLHSIYRCTGGLRFEVLVADNASPDRSITELGNTFPDVQLLLLEENKGFGAANNVAIEKAKGAFVFLLNPDTELVSDAATVFMEFMQQPENKDVAVCGGHLFTGTGKGTTSYGNFPSLLQSISSSGLYLFYKKYYREQLDTGVNNTQLHTREVDVISGAAMFIRKEALSQTGIFDTDFFLYFEETELSKRISRAGYRSVLIPSVRILHHEGGSSERNQFNAFGFYHFQKSRRLYYRKVYGNWYIWLASPFDFLALVVKALWGKDRGNMRRKVKLFFVAPAGSV